MAAPIANGSNGEGWSCAPIANGSNGRGQQTRAERGRAPIANGSNGDTQPSINGKVEINCAEGRIHVKIHGTDPKLAETCFKGRGLNIAGSGQGRSAQVLTAKCVA
jgi:hypothetical protein